MPYYTSIFEIYPQESRCYGTEDWHGDWNARLMFLAKDAGSSRIFRPLVEGGRGWRWITNHARPTNRNLKPLLDSLPISKLYASFLGPLLRNDDRESGELAMTPEIERFADDLFRWTVSEMSQLETVAVLGKEAWIAVTRASGYPERGSDWKRRHSIGAPLVVVVAGRTIALVALNHPARIPSATLQTQAGWLWIANRYGGTIGSTTPAKSQASVDGASTLKNRGVSVSLDRWEDFAPSNAPPRRPENIRGEMYKILIESGLDGASSPRFERLNWRDGLTAVKLRKAMGLLAGEARLRIQFRGDLGVLAMTTKWRLAPP